jgi:Skp family chaperone for outer membrane proteins
MNIRPLLVAGACVGALTAFAATAFAQSVRTAAPAAASAAPAAPPIVNGPVLPGVCFFSEQATIGQSLVGQAIATRLQQLLGQVRAEIQPQEQSYQTDGQGLEAARGTLSAAEFQKKAADLNLRRSNLDHLETQRQQELEYTQQKAIRRVDVEIAQVLPAVYQQHNCSLLINGQAVMLGNPGMDLTPAVVTALNARIQTLVFDREAPPAQAGAGPQQ